MILCVPCDVVVQKCVWFSSSSVTGSV
uniref:Uncharacterized protein n=1 Tax=Anguilla anguilla TaxID=7936 RepID=A0A0E9XC76_ANGAN